MSETYATPSVFGILLKFLQRNKGAWIESPLGHDEIADVMRHMSAAPLALRILPQMCVQKHLKKLFCAFSPKWPYGLSLWRSNSFEKTVCPWMTPTPKINVGSVGSVANQCSQHSSQHWFWGRGFRISQTFRHDIFLETHVMFFLSAFCRPRLQRSMLLGPTHF